MTSAPISICAVRAANTAGYAAIEDACESIFGAMADRDWRRARTLAEELRYVPIPTHAHAVVFETRAWSADTFLAEIAALEAEFPTLESEIAAMERDTKSGPTGDAA